MESNHPQQQQNEDLGKPAAVLPHDTSLETSATHTKTTTSEPFPCHAPPPPQIALKTKTVSRKGENEKNCRDSDITIVLEHSSYSQD